MNLRRFLVPCFVFVSLCIARVSSGVTLSMENYPSLLPEPEMQRLVKLFKSVGKLEGERKYGAAAQAMESLAESNWPFETDLLFFKLGLARLYRQANEGSKANALLERLEQETTAKHPLFPEIFYQLSLAILYSGDRTRGVERLDHLSRKYASSEAGQLALLALARTHREDGDFQMAWLYYDRYLATYLGRKERPDVLLEAVEMMVEAGQHDRAKELGLQLWSEIRLYPDFGRFGLRLINAFQKNNDLDSALTVAMVLCGGTAPQAQEGCFLVAKIQEARGDRAAAKTAYLKTVNEFDLSEWSVRAYRAIAKWPEEASGEMPELNPKLLENTANTYWPALMLEVAKLAAKKGLFYEVVSTLKRVPDTGDNTVSKKRARILLNACLALAEQTPDNACSWMGHAVAVRPLIRGHSKIVRSWLATCTPTVDARSVSYFSDLPTNVNAHTVDVLLELTRAWGFEDPAMRTLFMRVWDATIPASQRLKLAIPMLTLGLESLPNRWRIDLLLIESTMNEELPSGVNKQVYAGIISLLCEHGKTDLAVDWLLAFAPYGTSPGMTPVRKLLSALFSSRERKSFDDTLFWYEQWNPTADDLLDYAAKQVELRCVDGPALDDAWSIVERRLACLSKADASRFIQLVYPLFARRGSKYVEVLNAKLLLMAENEQEAMDANRQLGEYYLTMMDYEKAALHIEQAFGLSANQSDQDKIQMGMKLLEAAVEANYPANYLDQLLKGIQAVMAKMEIPERAKAGNKMAKMLEQLGFLEESRELFRKTADMSPDDNSSKAALYNLAKSYAADGQDGQAMATYMEYLHLYAKEADTRLYNIALANALAIAMKGADPGALAELQGKTERLINGDSDYISLLDMAQYFGRQGLSDLQDLLLEKGLVAAQKQIDEAESPDDRFKALEWAVKRLYKTGNYDEAIQMASPYFDLMSSGDQDQQSPRLFDALYECLRAMARAGDDKKNSISVWGEALLAGISRLDAPETEAKLMAFIAQYHPDMNRRWQLYEQLANSHFNSSYSLQAKLRLGAKSFSEGNVSNACAWASAAMAQANQDFVKEHDSRNYYNAIYLNATVMRAMGNEQQARKMEDILDSENQGQYLYIEQQLGSAHDR